MNEITTSKIIFDYVEKHGVEINAHKVYENFPNEYLAIWSEGFGLTLRTNKGKNYKTKELRLKNFPMPEQKFLNWQKPLTGPDGKTSKGYWISFNVPTEDIETFICELETFICELA